MGFVHNVASEEDRISFEIGPYGEYKHILDTDYENYMIIYFCEQHENAPQTRMFSIYVRDDPEIILLETYNKYLDMLEKKTVEYNIFGANQAIEETLLYQTHSKMDHSREKCAESKGSDLFSSEGAIDIQKMMTY